MILAEVTEELHAALEVWRDDTYTAASLTYSACRKDHVIDIRAVRCHKAGRLNSTHFLVHRTDCYSHHYNHHLHCPALPQWYSQPKVIAEDIGMTLESADYLH